MLLGVFESVCAPTSYSLIADYFPPEIRTTANAYFAGCIFVGTALSSISTVMVGAVGWSLTYLIVSIYGVCSGLLVCCFIAEPERGRFDPKKEEIEEDEQLLEDELVIVDTQIEVPESKLKKLLYGMLALVKNPCTRWIMIGGACRFW